MAELGARLADERAFFDSVAADWDHRGPADIDERLARVVALAEIRPGMLALDVGTGTGALVPHLVRSVGAAGNVVAIDISNQMLRVARSKISTSNVRFLLTSLEALREDEAPFDRVMCNAVFPHFQNKGRALAKAFRLLAPDGRLVLSHPVGREAVNRIHAQSDVMARDVLPGEVEIQEMLSRAGFEPCLMIDEPAFHFVSARKPS